MSSDNKQPINDDTIPLNSTEKLSKILHLLEILDKISYKQLNDPPNLLSFIRSLKQLHSIYFLCLTELLHIIQLVGFDKEIGVFLKLFQCFKSQQLYFLQYHQNTFRMKNLLQAKEFLSYKDNIAEEYKETTFSSTNLSQESLMIIIRLLEKLDYRHQYYLSKDTNGYEKLEKARFFLEQEGFELEEMLKEYKASKDEIEIFLKNRINLNGVQPSGVMKFLQGFLNETRHLNLEFKRFLEDEKCEDSKYSNVSMNKFDDLKSDIINKVDTGHRRFLKKIINSHKRSNITINLIEEQTQTDIIGIQMDGGDEDSSLPKTMPAMRKLLQSLRAQNEELSNKMNFINKRTDQLNSKIIAFEKNISNLEEEKQKLHAMISDLEFTLKRKRNKAKFLKNERKDLIDRLEAYVDKDHLNKEVLKNKNDDFEKNYSERLAKEKELYIEIKTMKEKIHHLEAENVKLNDIIEIEQKNQVFRSNDDNLSKIKGSKKNRMSTMPRIEGIGNIALDTKQSSVFSKETQHKELDKWMQTLMEIYQNSANKEIFEKNMNFLLQNKDNDLQKEKENKETILRDTMEKFEVIEEEMEKLRNNQEINVIKEEIQTENKENHEIIENNEILTKPINIIKKTQKPMTSESSIRKLKTKKLLNIRDKIVKSPKISKIISQPEKSFYEYPTKIPEKPAKIVKSLEKYEKPLKFSKSPKQEEITKKPTTSIRKSHHNRVKTEADIFPDANISLSLWTTIKQKHQPQPSTTYTEDLPLTKTPRNESKTPKNDLKMPQTVQNNENNENNENYAKLKYLYKYPFKDIDDNYGFESDRDNIFTNEEFFEKLYKDLSKKHEGCGSECEHLKRFYHRIHFMGKFRRKQEMILQKNLIDKLPDLEYI